ncbi:MAG: FHA domain-containing protein [Chloroflexi bacterium]|nr:FHA domain-containing protein [Chloroflexota bacterium]
MDYLCYNPYVRMRFIAVVGLLLVSTLIRGKVNAQSATKVFLSSPETAEFPLISAFLDIRDSQGGFIPNLQTQALTVIEDGTQLPASALEEVNTGMQFVLAVNTANSFAIIDQQLIKRYDYISEHLQSWAGGMSGTDGDDLSLTSPSGVSSLHQRDYNEWLIDLQTFQPNFQTAVPSLSALTSAIDLASAPSPTPGSSRVVLWLTPALDQRYNTDLLALEQRAQQAGVRVFIWMIDSQALFQSDQAFTLRAIADQTGGQFFAFSGIEAIPDLKTMLDATRKIYRFSYQSQITVAGSHELSVRVLVGETFVSTPTLNFDIELQPPSPAIVFVPTQISRLLNDSNQDIGELQPLQQIIEISVTFPDNIQRELVRTALFANGELVAENTNPPFERFTWDLSRYTDSQQVFLAVQVEDVLGLVGHTPEIPVQITVQGMPQGLQAIFTRYGSILVLGIVLVAAAVLLLVLLLAGRIQPSPLGSRVRRHTGYEDPVTQPIKDTRPLEPKQQRLNFLAQFARRFSTSRLPRLPKRAAPKPFAYLLPFSDSGVLLEGEVIPITAHIITLGSDAQQAFVPIDDPGVEPIHARLWRDEEGSFRLADENSIAGTWINYAPVSKGGSRIKHGDLIHIGRAGFRFALSIPMEPRKPIVIRDKSQE